MCLSDLIPNAALAELLDAADDNYPTPYQEDMDSALFSEICYKIDLDATWLAAAPRKESELLMLYFGDQVGSIKGLLEYRDLLWQCIKASDVEGLNVIQDIAYTHYVVDADPLEFAVAG